MNPRTLRQWIVLRGGLLTALLGIAAVTHADDPPNILFVLTDDQRPDTVHALGNEVIRTPTLDRLVREGTTFTRAITAIPICVASRAEILTGRNGLDNGQRNYGFSPAADVPCWAEVFRDSGYETCYVGKWHTSGRPSDRGYSRSEGLFAGGGKAPLTHPVDWKGMAVTGYVGWVFQTDNRQLFPERGVGLTPDISSAFADAAIRFLREPRERPFFLHVNFTAPHDPLLWPSLYRDAYSAIEIPLPSNFAPQHPFDHGNIDGRDERLLQFPRTSEETRAALAVYYAVIEDLDAQLGRILAALEETGQLERTVVVFSSDHGLAIGSHGLRGKQNMYEHTIGVPLIVRGPGVLAERRVEAPCYLRDLFPTTCDLCGLPIPPTVQGRSLRPLLEGAPVGPYDSLFASFRDSQRMIRTREWKLISYPLAGREQLFHLAQDPEELQNRIDDPTVAATAEELRTRLAEWGREHGAMPAAPQP